MAGEPQYIEIFHSKPSWGTAYVQRRDASSETGWAKPGPADAFVDATHIREQFRVFRADLLSVPGGQLDFVVSNGGARDWDSPPDAPHSWFSITAPGRYVVEHGCRRVGDADVAECERAVRYADDRHVSVSFVAELWEKCFLAYSADEKDWVPAPGVEMELVSSKPRKFSVTVPAKVLVFAFNNGVEGDGAVWDSNNGANFRIGLPGDYFVTEGKVKFLGRCLKDEVADADENPPLTKSSSTQPLTAVGQATA